MAREGKPPAYQHYPADYLSDEDTATMTLEEEGAYRRLLDHHWREGSIPADPEQLRRLLKWIPMRRFRAIWAKVGGCFSPAADRPERLVNERLAMQRQELEDFRAERSESGRKGAEAKKAKGGLASGSASQELQATASSALCDLPLRSASAEDPDPEEDLAVVAPGTHTPPLAAPTAPTTTPTTYPTTAAPTAQPRPEGEEQAAVPRPQGQDGVAIPRLQGEVSATLARHASEDSAALARGGSEVRAAGGAPADRETPGEHPPAVVSARAAGTSAGGASGTASTPGNSQEPEDEEDDMPDDPSGQGFKLEAPGAKPKARRKAKPMPPGAPTREQAEAAIEAASGGRYVAGGRQTGGTFKLDKARREHPDGAIFSRVGKWLAAGGDAWRGKLDGRALADLDAWIAQAKAWDGTSPVERGPPPRRGRTPAEMNSSIHVPDFDDIPEGPQR